jgi:hypothetical protein
MPEQSEIVAIGRRTRRICGRHSCTEQCREAFAQESFAAGPRGAVTPSGFSSAK